MSGPIFLKDAEVLRLADDYASRLHATGSKNEAMLIGMKLEGLKYLAEIRVLAAGEDRHQENLRLREAEVDAVHKAANATERVAAATESAVGQRAVGPCGDRAPYSVSLPLVTCNLPHGHAGGHMNGDMSWTHADPTRCAHRWSWGAGDQKHFEICTLSAGHLAQQHHNEVTGVFSGDQPVEDAEPTKPVADRLHELVSYLLVQARECRDEADRKRDVVGQEALKQPEDYMAPVYDEAATKLSEILNEGGI